MKLKCLSRIRGGLSAAALAWVWLAPMAWGQVSNTVVGSSTNSATNQLGGVGTGLSSSSDIAGSIVRMLGALAIVFAVFFLGVWLFRNWQVILRQRGTAPKLKVLEVKSLGTRQTLFVVGYERQRFLISSSTAGIALVTELPEAGEEPPQPAGTPPPFAEALLKVMSRKK
jgi:flagellar biogenesis protein FliO